MRKMTAVLFILLFAWVILILNTPFPSEDAARIGPLWELQSEQLLYLGLLGALTTGISLAQIRHLGTKMEEMKEYVTRQIKSELQKIED